MELTKNNGIEVIAGSITLRGTQDFSKLLKGKIYHNHVERIVGKKYKTMISIIDRATEMLLYVGDNESPKNVIIRTYNIEVHCDGRRAESIISPNPQHVRNVVKKLERMFQTGHGFSVEDFHTVIELEGFIDYKAIERAVIKANVA